MFEWDAIQRVTGAPEYKYLRLKMLMTMKKVKKFYYSDMAQFSKFKQLLKYLR